jgi:uncharacterized membrane protein YgdD (TMEM256/DUF423 family)
MEDRTWSLAMSTRWHQVSGLLGLTAVALGAYGAHAMKDRSDPMRETWRTASNYHFIHTMALVVSSTAFHGKKRNVVCSLFASGIVVFSGACYMVAFMNERKPYAQFAPFGGVLLMAGWAAFGFL